MDKDEILKKVIEITARVLKVDESEVTPESNFVFDLGAESVQSIELISAFEEGFNIEMDPDDAMEIQDVGKAAEFIGKFVK